MTLKHTTYEESFRRGMLRSMFHSLFWGVILERKRSQGLKMKDLADSLGVNKSFVSRSFSSPPNWRIDTISDFSEALGVDLIIEARDRKTGRVYNASGLKPSVSTRTFITADPQRTVANLTVTDKPENCLVRSSL